MITLDDALAHAAADLMQGRLYDPFTILGPHRTDSGETVRAFLPGAWSVDVTRRADGAPLGCLEDVGAGLFVGVIERLEPYVLRVRWPEATQETEDPYAFEPVLGGLDLYLFNQGRHLELAARFGAHPREIDGVAGVVFSVWAPNARRVSVVGDFNSWDGRRHPMRPHPDAGVWELFIPRLAAGERYKFEIAGPNGAVLPQKADPLARATEAPPATASVVAADPDFAWTDQDWMTSRRRRQAPDAPISIYEIHAGSWLRPASDGQASPDWDLLAERLPAYAASLGFTHVELMPIMEFPFGGSWGYQPLGLFAPSARFGEPEGFARFVDACHRLGVGVILDWVPAHFPSDAHGLAQFDGTALYEHQDPREGFHKDWNTLIYNLGRNEVRGFLLASALYWIETYHVDGLRVDAVASMLYRDYSREPGQWIPNQYGGRENLEAVAFLRDLNQAVAERGAGAMVIAEESTAWPGVTAPIAEGGLGFSYKWNMGWMHDTLSYAGRDPIHRVHHHHELTFGMVYAFSERFVLPLSHDEVVYGKGSLLGRMPGDRWRKFAGLRAYLGFMWTHPGKKLLFMGGELAQPGEWNHDGEIDWGLLSDPAHGGVQHLVHDLNRLYAREPALHASDSDPEGFSWVVGDDQINSVYACLRRSRGGETLLIALNMTPVERQAYRIPVPQDGYWAEMLNTDAAVYGGGNRGNGGGAWAHGHGIELTLPALSVLVLKPQKA
jgi:1,4-alpha-glucan branching enzyme